MNEANGPRLGLAHLDVLETPCLVLDQARMCRNIAHLVERLSAHGVTLRPHMKTSKSIDVAQRLTARGSDGITVSTMREAEEFAAHGFRDIVYAVGIGPSTLARATQLIARGVELTVILDSVEAADMVVSACREGNLAIPVLIEVDCDGHRGGVSPTDRGLVVQIARVLKSGGARVRGVLSHAGESYRSFGTANLEAAAEGERAAVVRAAELLVAEGHACPVVSVGSTPTAYFARRFDVVTEVRAGTFVFFDLTMTGIGVCRVDQIAISVLATVIGHQRHRGWTIIDAGWTALSSDRSTAEQAVDQGFGIVCDIDGNPFPSMIVVATTQEHGIVARRSGSDAAIPYFPVGTRVRILPNHACATAAQHQSYRVVENSREVRAVWPRFGGW